MFNPQHGVLGVEFSNHSIIYVQSVRCEALNRNVEIAMVRKSNPVGPEPLNPLLDARLSGMATGRFVLSLVIALTAHPLTLDLTSLLHRT